VERVQINFLKLVYPPITNQEAEWLKDDEEAQERLRQSNLYMIGQREEAVFKYRGCPVDDNGILNAEYSTSLNSSHFSIDINKMLERVKFPESDFEVKIECGEKLIRFWKVDPVSGELLEVVQWFTVEKILYDKWRGIPEVVGLDEYELFTNYKLHYVGISKKNDSLQRLVVQAHDKRIRILSNESAMSHGARLTDEVVLFFFRISPIHIKTLFSDDKIDMFSDELCNKKVPDTIRCFSDAEKAFVKILKSDYNEVKFKEYPRCIDGLYDENLKRYAYVISETITFSTSTCSIRGRFWGDNFLMPNNADMIFIQGDNVSLVKYDEIGSE
jgi:hypothetical protein